MSRIRSGHWAGLLLAVSLIGCQRAAPEPNQPPDPPSFLGSRPGQEREVAGVKLCWCPPGKFMMGSPPNEPERRAGEDQVEVTLTRGFWAGKYEVTQGQ